MRQLINPVSFVVKLPVGSCHLCQDSVQVSMSKRSVCGPHLGPFPPSLQGLEDPVGHTLGASAEVAGHDTIL